MMDDEGKLTGVDEQVAILGWIDGELQREGHRLAGALDHALDVLFADHDRLNSDDDSIARSLFIASERAKYYIAELDRDVEYYDTYVLANDLEAWKMLPDLRKKWLAQVPTFLKVRDEQPV